VLCNTSMNTIRALLKISSANKTYSLLQGGCSVLSSYYIKFAAVVLVCDSATSWEQQHHPVQVDLQPVLAAD